MNSNDNLYNYLKDEEFQNEGEFERQSYKNRIKELNLLLNINGFSEIGDLFDTSFYSVNKTLDVFKSLLDDRIKILESKAQLNKMISKSEEDYIKILEKSEMEDFKIKELNNKLNSMKNQLKLEEKRFKEEIEKLKNEKNEGDKIINRLTMKESQYKHEIRKYEKEIEEYKNKLKKIISDKDAISNNNNKTANLYSNSNLNFNSNNNFKISNNSLKSSTQLINSNDQSHNIKLPITLNSIIPDNESKNSSKILHNVEHLREFYNLIFNSMNEKIIFLVNQNTDMKECYKLIYNELNQFLEFKKMLLFKFAQDSMEEIKNMKDHHSIINYNIFELDFNLGRDSILQNFNDLLNTFRFMLIYEILRIDPTNEFDFEETKKIVSNKKFDLAEIPYYAEIKRKIESYDFKELIGLKNEIKNYVKTFNESNKKEYANPERNKNSMIFKNDSSATDNLEKCLTKSFYKNKSSTIDILEEINQNVQNAFGFFEERFLNLDHNIENAYEKI